MITIFCNIHAKKKKKKTTKYQCSLLACLFLALGSIRLMLGFVWVFPIYFEF